MPLIGISSKVSRNKSRGDKDNLIILREQLSHNDVDLIKGLPSVCTACKENRHFKIWIQIIKGMGGLGSFGEETVYWARCSTCSDGFEILVEDYVKIRPILRLNLKLKEGKITDDMHLVKVVKVKERLYKKLK